MMHVLNPVRRPLRLICLLLLAFAAGASASLMAQSVAKVPASAESPVDAITESWREWLGAELERRGLPGVSAAAVLPPVAAGVGAAAAGTAEPRLVAVALGVDGNEVPLTTASRLMSGSIGKTYCAAVALQLVGEGKLALDGKVAEVLGKHEWFARIPNAGAITLRQLLEHSAGIREHVWNPKFHERLRAEPDRLLTAAECLQFVLDDEPLFPAGERFAYADTNYLLAGLCIEAVTGKPFAEAMRTRLLEPLRLRDTAWNDSRRMPKLACGLASGIAFTKGPTIKDGLYFVNPGFEYCGGGVRSTPTDLARWCRELFAGDVIPKQLQKDHRRGRPAPRHVSGAYALGCFVGDSELGPALGHSGIMPGFLSYTLWFEKHDLAVALQFPSDDTRAIGDLRSHVIELARRALAALPRPASGREK
ncbi:MAG: beta-lactamase family protein [bacterium]|nr:beta-lactamase family protein [bacterium]